MRYPPGCPESAIGNESGCQDEHNWPDERTRIGAPEVRQPDGDRSHDGTGAGGSPPRSLDEEPADRHQSENAQPDRECQDDRAADANTSAHHHGEQQHADGGEKRSRDGFKACDSAEHTWAPKARQLGLSVLLPLQPATVTRVMTLVTVT
jgi:hypothetical protein